MNQSSHEGRVAVVTGAARGIGQALAKGLAARGARVAAVDIRNTGDTTREIQAAGGECAGFLTDITEPISSNSVGFPVPGYAHYMASKMGIIGLTRALATDVAGDGITVNAVGPSLTATPGMLEGVPRERLERVSGLQAIKRPAEPEDVVGTVLFLSSDDSYWVTGQTIMADGGLVRHG